MNKIFTFAVQSSLEYPKFKTWHFKCKVPTTLSDMLFCPDDFEPFSAGSDNPDDLTTGNLGHRIEKMVMRQEEFGVLDYGGRGGYDFEVCSYEMTDEHMLETITKIRGLLVEEGYKPTEIEYTEETIEE